MKNYVKNKRLGFGSVSLRYGHIRNVLFAHKDGKNRHFQKTKRDLLSPRITALDMEAIDILAGTKAYGETKVNDGTGNGDDLLGTKRLTYDSSWGADDDEE